MSEILKGLPKYVGRREPSDEFPKTLRFEDFGFTADKSLIAGQWNRIGAYTVEAGMEYAVGRRFDGFFYALLKDTANATFYGRVRLVCTNPVETKKETVMEINTRLCGDIADKAKKPVLPLSPPWVTQDSKIILEIDPEANNTLDFGLTISAIDVTAHVTK